jgi:hypothetical protein
MPALTPMCNACALGLPHPKARNGMSAGQVRGPRWKSQRQMPTVSVLPAANYKRGTSQRKPAPPLPVA